MARKKPASLTGSLLAHKGEATAAGFAMSALESYRAMEAASAPVRPTRPGEAAKVAPAPDRRRHDVVPGPVAEDEPLARPYPPLVARTVLIVEDNALDMKLFHDLLEIHGCSTLRARDGREALALARTERPDLIVMDVRLPGASGLEVTRWFKEDDDLKSIPVIAVSAYLMGGDDERFRKEGCETCIAKPISIAGFLRSCAEALPAARSSVHPL